MDKQHVIFDLLETRWKAKTLPQAILFHGDHWLDLEKSVVGFLKKMLQVNALEACPDCFLLKPYNKMRQIGAEDTREVVANMQKSPYSPTGYKICVVFEADRMNGTAANILLKTLEEPTGDALIFLMTTRLNDLLPTVLSRCVKFKLNTSAQTHFIDDQWAQWLQDYQDWQEALWDQRRTAINAHLLLEAYGLMERWGHFLEKQYSERWAVEKDLVAEETTNEELLAIQSGIKKVCCQQLFLDISLQNRAIFQNLSYGFIQATESLENAYDLLRFHLNESVALETFFLQVISARRCFRFATKDCFS